MEKKFEALKDILQDLKKSQGCSMHFNYFRDKCAKTEIMDKFLKRVKEECEKSTIPGQWIKAEKVISIIQELITK